MMTIEDINTIRLALATPEHNRHYEKHATDAHKILNKAEGTTRSNQNHGVIGDVIDYPTEIVVLAKGSYLNKDGAIVEAGKATINGEEYYIANKADLYCR